MHSYYYTIGFIAIGIHLIVNRYYLAEEERKSEYQEYRRFLKVILLYYFADAFWGILYNTDLSLLLYADTIFYYITMAFSVVFCCRYIATFLKLKPLTSKIFNLFGIGLAGAVILGIIVNHFFHIYFWFDETGEYRSEFARNLILIIQILMYGAVAALSFYKLLEQRKITQQRFRAISIFASCMVVSLTAQFFFPLLPFYTVGLMFGTLVVKVFIHNYEQQVQLQKIASLNKHYQNAHKEVLRQKDEMQSAFGVIDVLSSDFHTIWLVDKTDLKIRLFRSSPNETASAGAIKLGLENADYSKVMGMYIKYYIAPEDQERLLREGNINVVLQKLSESNFYFINYTRVKDDKTTEYCQVIFANVDTGGGASRFTFGFRNIDEILKQKVALEQNIAANEAKTKFLHNMSHEIRTPLNAMFGFSQLLGMPDGSWTEEEKAQYNSYIFNSYKMLEMLIGDILDIADSEHGNYRIEIADANINEIGRTAITSVEFRVPAGVNMYYTTDFADDYSIKSDSRRIQQILVNYLTNACKHTQQGEIHLHCSSTEHPGKITYSVTDTGRGVPKEMAEVIFNRFTKLNQFVQGSGLGLNICQTIADKLNGEVYLDTSYTNGARFVFVLNIPDSES